MELVFTPLDNIGSLLLLLESRLEAKVFLISKLLVDLEDISMVLKQLLQIQ